MIMTKNNMMIKFLFIVAYSIVAKYLENSFV